MINQHFEQYLTHYSQTNKPIDLFHISAVWINLNSVPSETIILLFQNKAQNILIRYNYMLLVILTDPFKKERETENQKFQSNVLLSVNTTPQNIIKEVALIAKNLWKNGHFSHAV